MIGFRAGEIVILTDAPDGAVDMIGRLVEIAESRVFLNAARWRREHAVVLEDVPMQLVCKPRTHEPLGAYPVAWMRPYDGGFARPRDIEVIEHNNHHWLMLDPPGAVMH